MREKIDSDKGRAIYAQRMGLIEPVFGHIQQRGLRRFTLRGQTKVDAMEAVLHCPQRGETAGLRQDGRVSEIRRKHGSCGPIVGKYRR
ncbi:MAG: transposase, partial [Xanthomonadales bacterium]|nr:transposase [Xanthomonadales bacterium]